MSGDPVGEQSSAWLDDELPPAEAELLAARLAQDPDRRAALARYALIGESLRSGPGTVGSALRLNERVAGALGQVPAVSPLAARPERRGLLLAAAAAIVGVAVLVNLSEPRTPAAASMQSAAFAPAVARPGSRLDTLPVDAALSQQRMAGYLVRHGEYSGFLSAKLTDTHIVNNRAYGRLAGTPEMAGR